MTESVTVYSLKESALEIGYSPQLGNFLENYVINADLDCIMEAIQAKMPEKEIIIRSLMLPVLDCLPPAGIEISYNDWQSGYRKKAEKSYCKFQTKDGSFDYEKYAAYREAAKKKTCPLFQ